MDDTGASDVGQQILLRGWLTLRAALLVMRWGLGLKKGSRGLGAVLGFTESTEKKSPVLHFGRHHCKLQMVPLFRKGTFLRLAMDHNVFSTWSHVSRFKSLKIPI